MRTKFSKIIFIVLIPNPMASTKFLSKLLNSKVPNSNVVKNCETFLMILNVYLQAYKLRFKALT
jgi:homoserine kinase